MKKDIETIHKNQEEMNNKVSEKEKQPILQGIRSRLDEAEDRINKLEEQVEKNTQNEQEKEKRLKKNKQVLRELQHNMKQ